MQHAFEFKYLHKLPDQRNQLRCFVKRLCQQPENPAHHPRREPNSIQCQSGFAGIVNELDKPLTQVRAT